MKIAVTGAAGFIGSTLCRHLCDDGHDVVAVLRRPERPQSLTGLDLETAVADVRDPAALATALAGADWVIHLAALFNRPGTPERDFRAVNVTGTRHVAEVALATGARLIHGSTVGVALPPGGAPWSEASAYSSPRWNHYEQTKTEAERVAIGFHREHALPVVVVRPTQVYGPADHSKAKFYRMVQRGVMVRPGDTCKHLVYVDDLARAFLACIDADRTDGEVFLAAGDGPTPLRDLIRIAADALDVPEPRLWIPAAPMQGLCRGVEALAHALGRTPPLTRQSLDFFVRSVEVDAQKIRQQLGWRPEVDVPTGVARTIRGYRDAGLL